MAKTAGITSESFEAFWNLYPKKKSKGDAWKAWGQIKPNEETVALILEALTWQPKQWDWIKDSKQFVPLPASWLRSWGWMDERPREFQSKPAVVGPPKLKVIQSDPQEKIAEPEGGWLAEFERKRRELK
jgi:hypothetical protein